MNGYADYAPSPGDPSKEHVEPGPRQVPLQEDVDMSGGSSGNETNENGSPGRDSQGSDCDDSGKELRTLAGPPGAHQGWVRPAATGAQAGHLFSQCLIPWRFDCFRSLCTMMTKFFETFENLINSK